MFSFVHVLLTCFTMPMRRTYAWPEGRESELAFNKSQTAIETMPPSKLPKALQNIAGAGLDLANFTSSDIAKLTPKQRADLHNAMQFALKKVENAGKLEQYKSLKTDEERRQAQVDFIIDTQAAAAKVGSNSSSVTVAKRRMETTVWLTLRQLAGPTWLNDEGHAKIVAEDGRPRRPYKQSAALANTGVEEFEFNVEELSNMKTNTFHAEVRAEAALDSEQYDGVKQAMDEQLNGQKVGPERSASGTPRKTTTKKAPASHEIFARFRLAKQGATTALNSVKASADKVASELAQVSSVKDRLVKKGWPESLGEHLDVEAKKVEVKAEEFRMFWAAESLVAAALPDGISGKEATLTPEQEKAIEQSIKDQNAKTTLYTNKKATLDGCLRNFVTGTLAGTIKLS